MADVQATILGQVYGGAGQPGKMYIRCQAVGPFAAGQRIVFGDSWALDSSLAQTLPEGAILLDSKICIIDAASALNIEAGYAAADGATGTTNGVADVNATYFNPSAAVSASEILRMTSPNLSVVLQRPTNPTVTIVSGAAGAEAMIEMIVTFAYHGNPVLPTVEDA